MERHPSTNWEAVSEAQFKRFICETKGKKRRSTRLDEKGKIGKDTFFSQIFEGMDDNDLREKRRRLERAKIEAREEKLKSLSRQERRYWSLIEASANIQMVNTQKGIRKSVLAPVEIETDSYARLSDMRAEEISEKMPAASIDKPKQPYKSWDRMVSYGLVAFGAVALIAGHLNAWIKGVRAEVAGTAAVPTWTPEGELYRSKPVGREVSEIADRQKARSEFANIEFESDEEKRESEMPAIEARVAGLSIANGIEIVWPESMQKLPGLGKHVNWKLNPWIVRGERDGKSETKWFNDFGTNPNAAKVYGIWGRESDLVIYGHSGNPSLSQLDSEWYEKLNVSKLEIATNARVALPFENIRLSYEENQKNGKSNIGSLERINVDGQSVWGRVVAETVVDYDLFDRNYKRKNEPESIVLKKPDEWGIASAVLESPNPLLITATCHDFDSLGKDDDKVLITVLELGVTQAEVDAYMLETLIANYSSSHKPGTDERLGEYIDKSAWGKEVRDRLDDKQETKWGEALRFADQMTYTYEDWPVQCMVTAHLMWGLGEGTPVGIPTLGAGELAAEGLGFNNFKTIKNALPGRNLVYKNGGVRMINGEMSGHVETIISAGEMLGERGFWVLRVGNNGETTREFIYEDELEKMLNSEDVIVQSLGNH